MLIGKCEKWTIAYRKRSDNNTILDDSASPFVALPNSWRYWRADPFLFEKDGKTYLFAELFDRVALRGVIGCCELSDKGVSKWKVVINESFHLSYPFLFVASNEIYMIPESFSSGKIILYKSINFPYIWEPVKIVADYSVVDSTLFEMNGKKYLITVKVSDSHDEPVVMTLDDDWNMIGEWALAGDNADNLRSAGNVFEYKNKLIRPSQDCSQGYGYALNFYEINKTDNSEFDETLVRKIFPRDLTIKGVCNPKGIHTYNFSSRYEVIDYKKYEFGLVGKTAKLIRLISRKIYQKV